jgi:hypothetical protein
MSRKIKKFHLTEKDVFGVAVRAKPSRDLTTKRFIDPVGFLSITSSPKGELNEEEQSEFSKWKHTIQSGDKPIYP